MKIPFFILLLCYSISAKAFNLAYVLTTANYNQVFTSINSVLQNYDGNSDISVYMISPDGFNLDLSPISTQIQHLVVDPKFQSLQFHCVPIADNFPDLDVQTYGPRDEFPKFMLGDILPNVDKVIFLSANTLVLRDLKEMWDNNDVSTLPFLAVIGPYHLDDVKPKYRHSIGCMLANLAKMRTDHFSSTIQGILRSGDYESAEDDDEFFPISPVDQALYQYYSENFADTPPLPIQYDAIASSIPRRSLMRSCSTSGSDGDSDKMATFQSLTVINFAGMKNWDECLVNSKQARRSWPYARWLWHAYMKNYVSDAGFPPEIQNTECCDDKCCAKECQCRTTPGWCALPHHKWISFGTVKVSICTDV